MDRALRKISWSLVGLGIVSQIFFSFSPLLLPGMASAEGVAVYPPATKMILGFSYRALPYAVFAVALAIAGKRSPRLSLAVYAGVIVAVLSPLAIMAIWSVMRFSVSQFREEFWPIRPVVQIGVFAAVAWSTWYVGSIRTKSGAA